MELEEIARRLQALEDVEAIKKLKTRFAYYCDDNYDADKMTACFVADAVFDVGDYGSYKGLAAIHKLFSDTTKSIIFAMHMVMNPVIEVDGETATGRWYLFEPLTHAEGKQAGWLAAYYEDEYIKVNGEWKFKHLRFRQYLSTPYSTPWSKTKFGPE